MEKNLEKKAVKIQGRSYVLVADRIIYFNENFPNGAIKTELITDPTLEKIVIKATVTPDTNRPERLFTGYSQTVVGQGPINRTSALENAETSAVGRALAMMGIGVIESVASADEVHKAQAATSSMNQTRPVALMQPTTAPRMSIQPNTRLATNRWFGSDNKIWNNTQTNIARF